MPSPTASAPTSAEEPLGGRYRLLHQLAQGGMAAVWEGYDEVLARPVAIKVLHPHLAADRLFLERFRREAIAAAKLSHPNVVATFDAGMAGESTAYIVMELIRGPTLRQLLVDKGAMPPRLVLDLARQITDALAHAHAAGLIHRDVKPANVLACDAGADGLPRVKVTDFGIAKAAEGLGLDLTKTGTIVGTPRYLSPEQIEGREPDARADLYALGVVMFEMLTGEPPFSGATDVIIALQHLNSEPPRVADRCPDVPPRLDNLVFSMMAKRPEDRPSSAHSVHESLLALEAGEAATGIMTGPVGVPASGPPPPDRGYGPPAASSIASAIAPSPPPPPSAISEGVTGGRVAVADRTPTSPGTPVPPRARTRKRAPNWPGRVVAALAALALLVVVLVAVGSGSNHPRSGVLPGPTTTPAAVSIADVSVFHLERDADHASQVSATFDNNPDTIWWTDTYFDSRFAGLRHGLGLAIRLGRRHRLHQLGVTSPSQGWSAEVYVADQVPSPPSLPPWGPPVATRQAIDGSTTFNLNNREDSVILLWLTDLGPANKVGIAELVLR